MFRQNSVTLLLSIILSLNMISLNENNYKPEELELNSFNMYTHSSSFDYESVCDVPSRLKLEYDFSASVFQGQLVHCGGVYLPQGYDVAVVIFLVDMTSGEFVQEQVIYPFNPNLVSFFTFNSPPLSSNTGWELGATPFYISTHTSSINAFLDWGPMTGPLSSPAILGTREAISTYTPYTQYPGRYYCEPHQQLTQFEDSKIVVKNSPQLPNMPIVMSSSKSWCGPLIIDRLTWFDYEFSSQPFIHPAAGIANNHHLEVETRLLTNDRTTPLEYDNVAGSKGSKWVIGQTPQPTFSKGTLFDGVDYALPGSLNGDWVIIETRARVISGLFPAMMQPLTVINSVDWRPVYTDGPYADFDKNGPAIPQDYSTLPHEAIGMTPGHVEFDQYTYSGITPIPTIVIHQWPTIGTTNLQNYIRYHITDQSNPRLTGFVEESPHHPKLTYSTGFTTPANTNQCPSSFSLVWEMDATLSYSISSVPGITFTSTEHFSSQTHQTYVWFNPISSSNYIITMDLIEHEFWSEDSVVVYDILDIEYDIKAGCVPSNLALPPGSISYSTQMITSNQHTTTLSIY